MFGTPVGARRWSRMASSTAVPGMLDRVLGPNNNGDARMRSLITAAPVALGLGLALPASAQVSTPRDPGQTSPLAARDAGQTSPLAKDPAKDSPLAAKDAGQESPLAKDPGQESPLAKPNTGNGSPLSKP